MQKILLGLVFLSSTILAKITNIEISRDYVEKSKIKIIDIRTESEWEKMGVIKGAYLITFFPETGECNPKLFMQELNRVVDKDEQFALISNTASRTKLVSNFLGKKNSYNVVNLLGGMKKLIEEGYEVEIYDLNKKQISVEKHKKVTPKKELVKEEPLSKKEVTSKKAMVVKKEEVVKKEKSRDLKDSNCTKV